MVSIRTRRSPSASEFHRPLKRQRWLRQAGAALICIFVFGAFCAFPSFAEVVEGPKTTECSFPTHFVLVEIGDRADAINIGRWPSCNYVSACSHESLELLNNPIREHFDSHFLPASYAGHFFNKLSLDINFQFMSDQYFSAHLNPFGGGSSFIEAENGRPQAVALRTFVMPYLDRVNADFRSVNGGKFLSGELQRFERQSCLLGSSNPQRKCERSHDESPERREKSIVPINETQRANSLGFEESGDLFALVFGTFGGVLAGFLTYAGLKRWCDLVFGPNKNGYGNAK
jgi:hypothetical protein